MLVEVAISPKALGLAAGTKPSKAADKFNLLTLLLVILVATVSLVFSSTLPMTDATVASVRALIRGDVVEAVAVGT